MSKWLDICPETELSAEGNRKIFDLGDNHIMIARHQGELYAVESMCSHAMFELDEGDISNCSISCPLHGAHFCLKTGEPLKGPALEPIATYTVRIHNGMIQLQDG